MSCSLTSDELFAIIAYTYDVRSANIEDNFYFQLNKCLRARQVLTLNWTAVTHFSDKRTQRN